MRIRRGGLLAIVGMLLAGGFAAAGSGSAVSSPQDPACELLEPTDQTQPVVEALCPPPLTEEWVARHDGPGNSDDWAYASVVNPDGSRVFVTGASHSGAAPDTLDYETIAYDTNTGKQAWVARYDGALNLQDGAHAIAVSPDGSTVFVTGKSRFTVTAYYDVATIAYDADTGKQLWLARYNNPDGYSRDSAYAIAMSPDGSTVFVAGSTYGSRRVIVAYDADTGEQLWVIHSELRMVGTSNDSGIAVSPDGSMVFVIGRNYSSTPYQDGIEAYDAARGAQLWEAQYNPTIPSGATGGGSIVGGVAVSGSKVIITGSSYWEDAGQRPVVSLSGCEECHHLIATVAFDAASGAQVWEAQYDSSNPIYLKDMTASPDGSAVYVTGNERWSWPDYLTVAYDAATGTQSWEATYTGPPLTDTVGSNANNASTSAVSPDGSTLYVTGWSGFWSGNCCDKDFDIATVAYDTAGGDQLGVGRYHGPAPANDYPYHRVHVAVSSRGSAFVTGYTENSDGDFDYVTIAYSLPPA